MRLLFLLRPLGAHHEDRVEFALFQSAAVIHIRSARAGGTHSARSGQTAGAGAESRGGDCEDDDAGRIHRRAGRVGTGYRQPCRDDDR